MVILHCLPLPHPLTTGVNQIIRCHLCSYIALLLLLMTSLPAWAFTKESVREGRLEIDDYAYVLPYLFYTDAIEFTLGGLFISEGIWQPQLNMSATAYTSANDSNGVWIDINDIKLTNRIGLQLEAFTQRWTDIKIYSANEATLGNRNSSRDNFLQSDGRESVWDLSAFFVLPMGSVKDNPIHEYRLNSLGILDDSSASGGRDWNPLHSGRSIITTGLYYNNISFEDVQQQGNFQRSLAAYLTAEYDNTDYFRNPTYGSRQSFTLKHDWGGSHSDVAWTTLEMNLSKYIDLGTTNWNRQQVLAFNVWYKTTPSWDKLDNNRYQRPPIYQRAGLGGFDRMRAYLTQRYNDHSAVYYSAEYRVIPVKNIFSNLGFLDSVIKVRWMQVVAFAEIGQVNNCFDFKELHKDMQWDMGLGIRALANGMVIRFDAAYGDEGGALSIFVGQTF